MTGSTVAQTTKGERPVILDRFAMTDKVAIVTGAGRGIGGATAACLAEAGADVFFCGEEGLEDVIAVFGGDAGAVVFDDDLDGVAGRILVAIDAHADGAAVGDGVGGVGDEVGDGLLELAGEGLDWRTVVEVADDDDVLGAEFIGVDVEDRLNEDG